MAVEAGGRLVEQQKRAGCVGLERGFARGDRGVAGEVFDQFQALGLAAAEGVQGLAEGQVAEADFVEHGEAAADGGLGREVEQGFGDRGVEQVCDGLALVGDGEDLGLEAAAFAEGAGDEDVGEELHFDALVAEALAVVAAAVAGVERERGRAEAGGGGGVGLGVKVADQIPGLGVEGGVGARGAGKRGLIDEDDFGEGLVAGDGADLRGVLGELVALGQQALVDDLVEQGGFAGAGHAGEGHETVEGEAEVEVAEVVFVDAGEDQPRMLAGSLHYFAAGGRRGNGLAAGKVGAGERGGVGEQGRQVALENQVAALRAGDGADFQHVVGGADHGLVVFDHDHGVAGVHQGADDPQQAIDVARVQADGGLVEDEQGVGERGA